MEEVASFAAWLGSEWCWCFGHGQCVRQHWRRVALGVAQA